MHHHCQSVKVTACHCDRPLVCPEYFHMPCWAVSNYYMLAALSYQFCCRSQSVDTLVLQLQLSILNVDHSVVGGSTGTASGTGTGTGEKKSMLKKIHNKIK